MNEITSQTTAAAPNRAGRWFLAAVGISLALIGGLFVWLMGRSFLRAYEMRGWPQVECVILASGMEERRHDSNSPLEYRQKVTFGYQWMGEARTGDKITLRGSPWSSKADLVKQRSTEWPVGKTTKCWVNPESPSQALLRPDSLAPGYSIWFPALFVIGGSVMAARAIRQPVQEK